MTTDNAQPVIVGHGTGPQRAIRPAADRRLCPTGRYSLNL
jgi:hypothetical protein